MSRCTCALEAALTALQPVSLSTLLSDVVTHTCTHYCPNSFPIGYHKSIRVFCPSLTGIVFLQCQAWTSTCECAEWLPGHLPSSAPIIYGHLNARPCPRSWRHLRNSETKELLGTQEQPPVSWPQPNVSSPSSVSHPLGSSSVTPQAVLLTHPALAEQHFC